MSSEADMRPESAPASKRTPIRPYSSERPHQIRQIAQAQ